MPNRLKSSRRWGLGTAFLLFSADRWLKIAANAHLLPPRFGFIQFGLFHNYGATLGIFLNDRFFLITVAVLFVVLLFYVFWRWQQLGVWFWLGWGLLLGGTLGNLYDRVRSGFVTDMLHVSFYPPIFNLADVGIRLGLLWMILAYWWHYRHKS